ncbi:ankyrin repeat domain-containing protein [Spongiibacter nanhainus]|uniref:Ankyrin repeat domain-containing protein n=1 Tax=Spongiibacter nanhainus TaxID=2794344 RepID=A0A7T4QYN5_9GAMM|nr:ankyrin repeat domain-containing protein [Spongiibacter nanhainus]QQD17089.1 ankyrin repeat domain-containing protein [Spongiibacter nanhainus]
MDQQLMQAINNNNLSLVKACLENGADPDYRSEDDDEEYPTSDLQPDTPLKMVVFRISDSFLTEEDLTSFCAITELLLDYGADPGPALKMAEKRYGKYDPNLPDNPFMDIYHVIVKAYSQRG